MMHKKDWLGQHAQICPRTCRPGGRVQTRPRPIQRKKSSKSRVEILNFFKPAAGERHFFLWQLVLLIELTPDASL